MGHQNFVKVIENRIIIWNSNWWGFREWKYIILNKIITAYFLLIKIMGNQNSLINETVIEVEGKLED
jgi:hypothetical protein